MVDPKEQAVSRDGEIISTSNNELCFRCRKNLKLSHVDCEDEVKLVLEEINKGLEQFKLTFDDFPRPTGFYLLVKVYTRPEELTTFVNDKGEQMALYNPASVRAGDSYRSAVGHVWAMGPDCYHGDRFKHSGPWCNIGDWVLFPKNLGSSDSCNGVPFRLIPDDKILSVLKDPSKIGMY